ncbi:hypothetical protein BSKO_08832 [Bryopsis sp. KO-2023]|nr:hypothetical protein BSKO_08832 [Bryopsis sp. KO-2023]
MAQSQYEYVKKFEREQILLDGCWVVVRLDGKGFTKFCTSHEFEKPNDMRALNLMDECAKELMKEFQDIRIAFGQSDEYSFVLAKDTNLYGRRAMKIVSTMTSCFSSNYVRLWSKFLPDVPLQYTPVFDGRAVEYPADSILRDYLSWRQADTHVNNQYNTCFWALVKSGKTPKESQEILKGTQKDFKNELLFSQFGINYTDLPEQFKKGSVLIWGTESFLSKHMEDGSPIYRDRRIPTVHHVDIIKNKFWKEHPEILK